MPLTPHGERMRERMHREYGSEGDRVLYASENAGKAGFTNIHRGGRRGKRKHHRGSHRK